MPTKCYQILRKDNCMMNMERRASKMVDHQAVLGWAVCLKCLEWARSQGQGRAKLS